MSATSVVWKNSRPQLAIHWVCSRNEGKSLDTTIYKIESIRPLNREAINRIRAAHLIGGGQEWCVKSQHDGSEEPAGKDLIEAVEISNFTGDIVNYKPKHSYTGNYYKPIEKPYYQYIIEDTCDSSD